LSTRPEKFLGEIDTWDKAEELLRQSLVKFDHPWEINEGDGAFYGPKIDIVVSDALRRKHQCATIQLDFQLPERFKLEYRTDVENQMARPVMIHRAILGSVERMIAILTENFGGKWPFWLSPRQVIVIPVALAYNDYAAEVASKLHNQGIFADTDLSSETLKKKIRNAEVGQWNFIFVVGEEEQKSESVNFRNRDDPASKNRGQTVRLSEILSKLLEVKASRTLDQVFEMESS
jgi:threonyl-tRNA synthetase